MIHYSMSLLSPMKEWFHRGRTCAELFSFFLKKILNNTNNTNFWIILRSSGLNIFLLCWGKFELILLRYVSSFKVILEYFKILDYAYTLSCHSSLHKEIYLVIWIKKISDIVCFPFVIISSPVLRQRKDK